MTNQMCPKTRPKKMDLVKSIDYRANG